MTAAPTIRIARRRRIGGSALIPEPHVLGEKLVGLLASDGSRLTLFTDSLDDVGEIAFGDAGPVQRVVLGTGPGGVPGIWAHAGRTVWNDDFARPTVSFFALPDGRGGGEERVRIRGTHEANTSGELIVDGHRLILIGDGGMWGGGGGTNSYAAACLEAPLAAGAFDACYVWSLGTAMPDLGRERYDADFRSAWLARDGVLHAITSGFEWWRIDAGTGARLERRALAGMDNAWPRPFDNPGVERALPVRDGWLVLQIGGLKTRFDPRTYSGMVVLYDERGHLVHRADSVFPVAAVGDRVLSFVQGVFVVLALPRFDVTFRWEDDDAYHCRRVACEPGMKWAIGVGQDEDSTALWRFELSL